MKKQYVVLIIGGIFLFFASCKGDEKEPPTIIITETIPPTNDIAEVPNQEQNKPSVPPKVEKPIPPPKVEKPPIKKPVQDFALVVEEVEESLPTPSISKPYTIPNEPKREETQVTVSMVQPEKKTLTTKDKTDIQNKLERTLRNLSLTKKTKEVTDLFQDAYLKCVTGEFDGYAQNQYSPYDYAVRLRQQPYDVVITSLEFNDFGKITRMQVKEKTTLESK